MINSRIVLTKHAADFRNSLDATYALTKKQRLQQKKLKKS
jgi:hypothetical protein